jgi:hypothetical protein
MCAELQQLHATVAKIVAIRARNKTLNQLAQGGAEHERIFISSYAQRSL